MSTPPTIPARICALCVRFYQLAISPIIHIIPGSGCRFYPTCSEYTLQAILKFGAIRGIIMGACRILRCNPLCKGGIDEVPDKFVWKNLFSINDKPSKKVDEFDTNIH